MVEAVLMVGVATLQRQRGLVSIVAARVGEALEANAADRGVRLPRVLSSNLASTFTQSESLHH